MSLPKPYFQDDDVTIYHADCRDILPLLEPGSIDLVLTSPPYNLGNDHHTDSFRHSPYDDALPEEEYQHQQVAMLTYLFSIVSDSGSLLYNHKNRIKDGRQISPYRWLWKTPWLDKQEIVWENRSHNFDPCRFLPETERVYWLTKQASTQLVNESGVEDIERWPPEGTAGDFKRAFPLMMARQLVHCFPDAHTILDPFMGSGTTLVAAQSLGRKSIGIEIEERYCQIAVERLRQKPLPLAYSTSHDIIRPTQGGLFHGTPPDRRNKAEDFFGEQGKGALRGSSEAAQ